MQFEFIDHFLDGIAVVNFKWEVVYANTVLCDLVGISQRRITGVDINRLMPIMEISEKHEDLGLLHDATPYARIHFVLNESQKEFGVCLIPFESYVMVVFRDWSVERELQEKYQASLREKQKSSFEKIFLTSLSNAAHLDQSFQETLDTFLPRLLEFFELDLVLVYRKDGIRYRITSSSLSSSRSIRSIRNEEQGYPWDVEEPLWHENKIFFPLQKANLRYGMLVMSGDSDKLKNVDESLVVIFCQNLMNLIEKTSLQSELHQDPLTRVANRRYFETRWRKEFTQAMQQKSQLTLMLVDIDFFKKINDRYGHSKGDEALFLVAQIIVSNIRPTDVVARWGGEEFAIILPETSPAEASIVAERIRSKIEGFGWGAKGYTEPISASLGIGSYPPHGDSQSEIYEAADKALYESKKSGRNKYTIGKLESKK